MVKKLDKAKARAKRHQRVRNKINGTADCPRLNVFRSSKHIYAQVIDDVNLFTFGETNITRLRPSIFDGLSTTPASEIASLNFARSSSPNCG